MAKPTDRVQVLKQESTAGGGDPADASPFDAWEQLDESEDGISAAGVFLQKQGGPVDENAAIWREGDNILAQDPAHGAPVNLLDASADGAVIVRSISSNLTVTAGTTRLHRCSSIDDGVELLVEDDGEFLVL